jgi:hypothetical protein
MGASIMSSYDPLSTRVAFAGVTALAMAGYLVPYALVGAWLIAHM